MENRAFVALVHCAGTLGLNMLIKAPLTGFMRYKQGSFANPEDALVAAKGDADEAKKLMGSNEEVERVRRSHQNDLENVPIFMLLGLFYLLAKGNGDDSCFCARFHFYGFTAARVSHSISYLWFKSQNMRGISFMSGLMISLSLAIQLCF